MIEIVAVLGTPTVTRGLSVEVSVTMNVCIPSTRLSWSAITVMQADTGAAPA